MHRSFDSAPAPTPAPTSPKPGLVGAPAKPAGRKKGRALRSESVTICFEPRLASPKSPEGTQESSPGWRACLWPGIRGQQRMELAVLEGRHELFLALRVTASLRDASSSSRVTPDSGPQSPQQAKTGLAGDPDRALHPGLLSIAPTALRSKTVRSEWSF